MICFVNSSIVVAHSTNFCNRERHDEREIIPLPARLHFASHPCALASPLLDVVSLLALEAILAISHDQLRSSPCRHEGTESVTIDGHSIENKPYRLSLLQNDFAVFNLSSVSLLAASFLKSGMSSPSAPSNRSLGYRKNDPTEAVPIQLLFFPPSAGGGTNAPEA